ncbi:MAG: SPOR domain-containing protein [Bacteroidota bacterium]
MKILFLFIIGLFISNLSLSQVVFSEEADDDKTRIEILEELDVNRDARLDKMLKWHIEKNQTIGGMEGYRIEIFFSSSHDALEKARKAKVDFLSKYHDYPVNIKFVAPNFRVRVGDFRTKNEALKLYKKIQADYPAAFIVPDIIDFPLLKKNQYE